MYIYRLILSPQKQLENAMNAWLPGVKTLKHTEWLF